MITHQQISLAIKIIDHILDLLYEVMAPEYFEIKQQRELKKQRIINEKSKEI